MIAAPATPPAMSAPAILAFSAAGGPPDQPFACHGFGGGGFCRLDIPFVSCVAHGRCLLCRHRYWCPPADGSRVRERVSRSASFGMVTTLDGLTPKEPSRRALPRPGIIDAMTPTIYPYAAEIDAERVGWYELADLIRRLTPDECLVPGYYRDPDWTVRDLVAHVGTWLAEAEVQLEQINAGTYEGHDVDIDGLNAAMLEAMHDQPWSIAWVQANAARTRMLQALVGSQGPQRRGGLVDFESRVRGITGSTWVAFGNGSTNSCRSARKPSGKPDARDSRRASTCDTSTRSVPGTSPGIRRPDSCHAYPRRFWRGNRTFSSDVVVPRIFGPSGPRQGFAPR